MKIEEVSTAIASNVTCYPLYVLMGPGYMFYNSFLSSIHLISFTIHMGLGMLMIPKTAAKKTDDYITYIITMSLEDHVCVCIVCVCVLHNNL